MAVRLLKNEELAGLVAVADLIDPMAAAFAEHGRGLAPDHARERLVLPLDDREYWFNNIMGAVPGLDVLALRIDSAHRRDRGDRHVYVGDYTGLVLLFDVRRTDLLAVMDDHVLSPLRVAATSAVAARHLARADATRLGLFGTGKQAAAQLEAFQHVCGFDEIRVYSPTPAHRGTFAERFDDALDAAVSAVDEPRSVVEGADVVVTATNSNVPVFDGEWLAPGTHVSTTVGGDAARDRDEVDATTVRRADRIVCNRVGQVLDDEQGHLYRLLASGELSRDDVAELGELVAGRSPGRVTDERITLYKNNCGMGLQFAVAAKAVYDAAEARGIGRELPSEWFVTEKDGGDWSP